METRHFNLLALAAVISLIAAGVVHSAYDSLDQEAVTGRKVFPSLEGRTGSVQEVVLSQGSKTITLKKDDADAGWGIVERGGYPVDAKKVREIVLKLAEAELIEPKTREAKRYGQLDLGDPKEKGAEAKLVRLAGKNGAAIAEIVVGKNRYAAFGTGKSGTYLRKPGDPQTWLAKLDLKAPMDVADWVQPAFFSVPKEKIKSLVVMDGGKQVYKLMPDDKAKGKYKVIEPAEGRTFKDGLKTDEMVTGVRTLEMLDVRKRTAENGKAERTAVLTMDDGTRYTIGMKKGGKDGRERWMTIDVKVASDAKGSDKTAAEKIAAATKNWSYRIAEWRARQTFLGPEDAYTEKKAAAPKADDAPAKVDGGSAGDGAGDKASAAPGASEKQ